MKKIITLVLLLLALHGRSIYAQPLPLSVTGSIGGGLMLPESNFSTLYSKSGYTLGGKLRVGLPAVPFTLVGLLNYSSVSNDLGIISYSTKISTIGAGVEYNVLPLPVVKPYVGVDAAMNLVSSTGTNTATRFGLGIGVGATLDIPLSPISFDLEAKYRFANLVGKSSATAGSTSSTSADFNDNGYSLNYIAISLGVVFKIL
jgi:hypothetical protein